jgi:FMN-dependent NADH-azoreductase
MATVLKIDASARVTRSLSRVLTTAFTKEWLQSRPNDTLITRDVGLNPPPAISEAWIVAAFTAPEQRTLDQHEALKISDRLLVELEPADLIRSPESLDRPGDSGWTHLFL